MFRSLFIAGLIFLPLNAEADVKQSLSQQEIGKAIAADLADHPRLTDNSLKVKVADGLVTLSGQVENLLEKRRAGQIAKRTRGVQAVLNRIVVLRSDRSDDEIREDVVAAIAADRGIDKPQIVINVERGEVAMVGKVDSLAEKRLAEVTAAGISGVTDVTNQLTVALSSERTDGELQREIAGLIEHSVYLDDADLQVKVRDHQASISGTVATSAEKDHLARVAEVWGISAVNLDDVTVDPESAKGTERKQRYGEITDPIIEQSLRRALYASPITFSYLDAIEISVADQVVTLRGEVPSLRVKRATERTAMDVVGVRRVANELEIKYDGKHLSDEKIIHMTQAALKRSAYLERRDIRVHCQGAHVSLYGVVDSELEKEIAEYIADGIPGVVHVANQLAVENTSAERKSDEEIAADLERKLKFVFFDKSNEVNFEVESGVVILRGEVDTWRQWQTAMDLALEAGARSPHNLIRVRYHPPHGASRVFVPR